MTPILSLPAFELWCFPAWKGVFFETQISSFRSLIHGHQKIRTLFLSLVSLRPIAWRHIDRGDDARGRTCRKQARLRAQDEFSLKEAGVTLYWMELFYQTEYMTEQSCASIRAQ